MIHIKWHFGPCVPDTEKLSSDWQPLVDRYCAGNAALDQRFMRLLVKHYGSGSEILALGFADNRPIASAILAPAGFGRWTLFQPGQACLSPIIHADDVDLASVLPSLVQSLPRSCWRLQMPRIDPLYQKLDTLDPRFADIVEYGQTFAVNLKGTFDAYWNARKKGLRQNQRRWFRKLEQEDLTYRLESWTSQEDMPRAVEFHATLESHGWKAEHGSAIGTGNKQGRFYTELLSNFAADNSAVTFQLYLGDIPAASLLGIVGGGVIIILKTAHNENLRDCSPGRIIDYLALKECFSIGQYRAMDMYTRASSADLAWGTDTRTIYVIDAYSSHLTRRVTELLRFLRPNRSG